MRPYPTDAEFSDALATAFAGVTSGHLATPEEAHAVLTLADFALEKFAPTPPASMSAPNHTMAAAHLQQLQLLQPGQAAVNINWGNLLQVLLVLLQQYLSGGGKP